MDKAKRFTDIHAHIIFGADDGPDSLAEAVAVLKLDCGEGASAVFATPHYGRENNGFVPEASMVMRNFELLKEKAREEIPEIRLYLGTEWYCAWNLARRIRRREAFRMNETDYVLVQFLEGREGEREPAEKIIGNLAELKKQGFRPILAHPERYRALQNDRDLLKKITDYGVLLQVDAYDLDLNLGLKAKELARWLAEERMISFIGSGMHGLPPRQVPRVKEGIRWLYDNTDEAYADAVAFGNAERLLGVSS